MPSKIQSDTPFKFSTLFWVLVAVAVGAFLFGLYQGTGGAMGECPVPPAPTQPGVPR